MSLIAVVSRLYRGGLKGITAPLLPIIFAARLFAAEGEASRLYKTAYRVIDVHSHGAWATPAVLRAQLDALDGVGVDGFTLVLFDPAGWQYKGGWSEENLRAWLELRKQAPERVNVFGTVDFGRAAKEPDFFRAIVTELETEAKLGMQGLKIWKNLGMHHRDARGALLKIDDPRLDPLWAKCGELGLPVLIHTADPREYWIPNSFDNLHYNQGDTAKYHQHGEVPVWEELMRQRNRVVKKHPRTTFIGAHMASHLNSLDELAALLDEHRNLYVECGARLRFFYRFTPDALRAFYIKYQDRVLFGTDAWLIAEERQLQTAESLRGWKERQMRFYSQYLEYFETDHHVSVLGGFERWMRLKGIKLPPEVLEKLYHANAERIIPGMKR